jgi:hypothetical protein
MSSHGRRLAPESLTGLFALILYLPAINHGFSCDIEALPESKPWTSQKVNDDPENFQFVTVGDGGGALAPASLFTLTARVAILCA